MLEHSFSSGTPFSVGIEEELMLIDSDSLDLVSGVEQVLADMPAEREGQVKTELFQSVLEIATRPCEDVTAAGEQLRELRELVREVAGGRGFLVGASGTHPFARCDEQKIVDRPRYREIVETLGFIAERELIFGTHVHVGIDSPDKAIYVADGIRRYLPLMLAISSNSPFWEGRETGMASARTPVFRAFPRVGVPPHYGSWEIFSTRVEQMMRSGAIGDYTYLWWDVRPHPNLGTVETRIFDQANLLEDTLAFAAMTQSLAYTLAQTYEDGEPLFEVPWELVDDNKVRAALRGMDGELLDLSAGRHVPATELAERVLGELREGAGELGCSAQLERVAAIVREGTGSRRQLEVAARHNGDLRELVREAVLIGD